MGTIFNGNYFIGVAPDGQLKLLDKTKPATGKPLQLEVRYNAAANAAVIVDVETGKFLTTDAQGNVTLTSTQVDGSLWEISNAFPNNVDKDVWFSLKSKNSRLPNNYLKHMDYSMYAHQPGKEAAEYFNANATRRTMPVN